eukprot:343602_1
MSAEDETFKIGDKCEVYSNSNKKWFQGEVIEEVNTKRGLELTVRYRIGTKYAQKRVSTNSNVLRKIDIANNKNTIECVCGEKMLWMFARNCYINENINEKEEEDEKLMEVTKDTQGQILEEKVTETNKSTVSCDCCSYKFNKDEQLFHCPKGIKSPVHKFGSDLCYKCAMYEADETIQNVRDNDAKEDGTIAMELGDEPFAEGSSRYAYLGLWQTGKKKGMRCVIKRYKDKHFLFSDGYDGDIKCCKLAAELVQEWNEMNLIDKKYEVIVPIIARKEGQLWELKVELMMLLALLGVEASDLITDLSKMLDSSAAGKEITSGEVVMVEDYLKGDFLKWNSNSGWMNEIDISVQAFCHWTYHYSDGQYLFCDAQGVKRAEKYILTDPAILSNTEKGGVYGITDCGRKYLLNWFRQHKCNGFCNKSWKKPKQIELDSVPQNVRKSITKSTSFNVTRIIRSHRLDSCGSIMASSIALNDNNYDIDEKENKYENKEWRKYDKYLSWQNGERIIICSKVVRLKTFSKQNRVLLLSSFEKLYLIDPSRTSRVEEFSKQQVKKVQLKKNDKYTMILHLLDNKIWFTLIDVINGKNDIRTWKTLIDSNMKCN